MSKIYILLIPIVFLLFASCKTTNLFETSHTPNAISIDSLPVISDNLEHKLKPNDKISVSVSDHDDLSIGSIFGPYNSDDVYGKWVLIDTEGEATLPKVGKIKLAGLTLREAELKTASIYGEFIVNPIVVITVHNWEVTLLGEVIIPGVYSIEKMNNTMIEYIGKAGGFDAYANMKEVQLIRKNGRDLEQYIFDLTNLDGYTQLQVNLHPDDVIYIPSTRGKKLDQRVSTLLPFASFISALAIIATLIL